MARIRISWQHDVNYKVNKGKVYPRTGHKGPEEDQRYSSTLSLTSVLDVGGC
jgi:hypothetical protein